VGAHLPPRGTVKAAGLRHYNCEFQVGLTSYFKISFAVVP
jgi:hypothetical protein